MNIPWANTNVANPFYNMPDNKALGSVAISLTSLSNQTNLDPNINFGVFQITYMVRVRGVKAA